MQVIVTVIAAAFAAIIVTESSAFAADGKLSDWGPFKFGTTAQQIKALAGGTGAENADPSDAEITSFVVPSVKFVNATGSVTIRFYKDRAYELSFFTLNAVDAYVPPSNANWAMEQKIGSYCGNAFAHVLDIFSATYGKPDELIRPGELTQHDQASPKTNNAR